MIRAQRPGVRAPDRHSPSATDATAPMTESNIAKKLSGIPPWPVHSRQDDQVLRELEMSVEQLAEAVQRARPADPGADKAAIASSAFSSDAHPDPIPVAVEPYSPRLQWFTVDLQSLIPPSLAL